ncbi:MAG: hypothetical protein ACM3ZE_00275 [Myxococcales bacterium]
MPATEPEPTLVTLSSTTGAGATVKPAAMIDGYSSPGGISRAGLDAQPDSTFAERTTGANASAHLKRLVWYPGTPGFVGLWPGMSSYLLRHTSNGQKSYTYVATVGPGQRDMSTRGNTIVSTGWFADLERRITAVQPIDWSRPRYDGFGLPSNWVPPADASLMGGAAGEESYQYLLRSAKAAAEEATAAVKTAIDKLVEEAQDGAALQQAETKAQAIGKLEQKALCGNTEACTLPMATVRFEHEDVDEVCSGVPTEGQASCKLALWRANDALRTNWLPEVVANRLKYTSETYSDPEYEGSELQRVLVRIWNAGRLLNATRDKSRAEAQDYGREYAAVEAAKASASSEYEAALAELEALDDAIVTSDPTKKKQIEALEFSVKAAEERVQTAGVYVNQYCEGDVDRRCTYDCSNLRTHCTEDKCTKTYLTVDPKSIYDACKDDKLEQCGHGATEGFGSSPNNLPCRDALLGYQGALTNQTEVGKNTDAQLAVITDGDPNLELKQKSVAAKRTAALERKQAALAELGARKSSAWTQVLSQYGVMRQIKGELQSALAELEQLQLRAVQSDSRAKLEVSASASAIENNASLRRRYRSYDMWRAEALLESARRLAVTARRAIESRFVVDLSTLDSQQAFVASPSAWADEIYESDLNAPEVVGLSQSSETGDAIYPNKLIDYVENLERFVQGYTITYPTSVSLPDTEVITLGAPNQLTSPNSSGTVSLSPDTAGWRFYCPEQGTWIAHPGVGQYPLTSSLDSSCAGSRPTLAKIGFWLDSWGTLNGAWTRAPYVDRHNVRWRRLAVNLVGTGIRECSKSTDAMSCYTSPYVRFNLIHTGPSWQTNHALDWRVVDLPTAHIEAGKALAAEEWLEAISNSWNMPYVSNVARGELFGRATAGNYELVLEITPDVRLDRIERIQLLVEQDYWVKQTGGRGALENPLGTPTIGAGGASGAGGGSGAGGSASTGGTTGSGGTTGAGGSSAGTSAPGPLVGSCTPTSPSELGIDDFEDGNRILSSSAQRLGIWYGFHAGTCAADPATGDAFLPKSPSGNGSLFAAHTQGTACQASDWAGGGIGFNFLSSTQNGIETVCANYDASAYTGIGFDAKGTGEIRVEVCISDVIDNDCHGAYFGLSSTTWTRYDLRWAMLTQNGWGTVKPFNMAHLKKIQFLSKTQNFSFDIDNVSFLNN